jgi:aryl-alcohol dehydrogenase-like predicted oxidoreductase
MPILTRREATAGLAATLIAPAARAQTSGDLLQRAIPHGGEALPAVGLGTAINIYYADSDPNRQKAAAVLEALIASGARLVDTASVYGEAETVLGAVIAAHRMRDKLFIASKLEGPNPDELKRSLARLQVTKLDLLQFHNVRRADQSLSQFRRWKAQGVCRYIGITSTYRRDLPAVEAVVAREKPDFVQVDYSIDNREVEKRLLPAAADAGVLTALPFGRGRLFRAVHGRELPDWAHPFAASWAQFFLKYLLGDARVTAVIPGTADPGHMTDNAGAMRGPLPDAAQRQRMREFVDAL